MSLDPAFVRAAKSFEIRKRLRPDGHRNWTALDPKIAGCPR